MHEKVRIRYNHFRLGFSNDHGREKENSQLYVVDYLDMTEDKRPGLQANHSANVDHCGKLKNLEDFHILRPRTMFGKSSLNRRDEIRNKARCQW